MTASAFRDAWHLDPGFDIAHTAVLTAGPAQYGATREAALETMRAVAERVAAAPGVRAVTIIDRAPYQVGYPVLLNASTDGRDCADGGCTRLTVTRVDRGYFDVSSRRLVAGQLPEPGHDLDSTRVVINEAAAGRLWPGRPAVGSSFKDAATGLWREVSAVVANTEAALGIAEPPLVLLPLDPAGAGGSLSVIARGDGPAASLVGPMRDALRSVDAALPVQSLQTMDERMALPLWLPRTTLGFFTVCAALAVLLSTVGLFGVTYFAVNQRRREFGVRSALGATVGDLRRLVLGETVRLAAPGVALGLALAMGTGLVAESLLTSIPAPGLAPYGLAVLIQVGVTIAAGWSPARRAASAAPVEVLRE
jgi:hypothetical protein